MIGLLIGSIFVLATGRKDRRLRERDEIADSIGVPVLMSISVSHPSDAAGWARLFEDYQPGAVDEWRLRKTLRQLGLTGVSHTDVSVGSGSSLAVLSLSSDPKALALGPQLAVFAASLGIPTCWSSDPQQDVNATAMLRAACAAPPKPFRAIEEPAGHRRAIDSQHRPAPPGAKLTVVVFRRQRPGPPRSLTPCAPLGRTLGRLGGRDDGRATGPRRSQRRRRRPRPRWSPRGRSRTGRPYNWPCPGPDPADASENADPND